MDEKEKRIHTQILILSFEALNPSLTACSGTELNWECRHNSNKKEKISDHQFLLCVILNQTNTFIRVSQYMQVDNI